MVTMGIVGANPGLMELANAMPSFDAEVNLSGVMTRDRWPRLVV